MSPRKKIESDLYLSLLGFFIQKPNYGYELYKYISTETPFFTIWFLKQSQFYGLLDRLHNEGFLSLKTIEGELYPDRKLFSLTISGKIQLDNWLISPVKRGRDMRQEFIAKLYIAQKYAKEKIKILVGNQLSICEQCMKELDGILEKENDSFKTLLIN